MLSKYVGFSFSLAWYLCEADLWPMPRLHFLDVSSNNLTGTLPNFADWNVSSAGVVFNLSNNMFYGLLNTSLDRFKMIDLSSNFLEGGTDPDKKL